MDETAIFAEHTLKDRWTAMRDQALSNPKFLRFARTFPLTNWIAKRRARDLFDLCAGFVYTQVLLACVRLELFARLADGPRSIAQLACDLSLSESATRQLLLAATSLELTEARGEDRFGLGTLGVALLANPGVSAMVEHHAMFYADLKDPVALLRGEAGKTQLSKYWSYADYVAPEQLTASDVEAYSTLMARSVALVAEEVIDAYPIEQYQCLLDVAGGEGGFLVTAAARAPRLRLMLFDLEPVAAKARSRLAQAGLSSRSQVHGGDLFKDPLPHGADLATLLRVLHDHDDEHALAILRSVRAALPDHGILLVAEPMSGTKGAEPVGDAYFSFYLRAMGRGQARTREQLTHLLNRAGFPYVRLLPTSLPLQTQLLMASPRG